MGRHLTGVLTDELNNHAATRGRIVYGKVGGVVTTVGGGSVLAPTGMSGFAAAGMAVAAVTLVMAGAAILRIVRRKSVAY